MEKQSTTQIRLNYKITVVLKDEVITSKFYRKDIAIDTMIEMRNLFPELFLSGALEERRRKWEVIWTLEENEKK